MLIDVHVEGDESNLIEVDVQQQITPTGKPSNRFTGYIRHRGLDVGLKLVDSDLSILKTRLQEKANEWVEEWNVIEKNKKADINLEKIKSILNDGVKRKVAIDWEKLKDEALFPKEAPVFKELKPKLEETHPKPNFLDKLIKSRYERLLVEQKQNYEEALKLWKDKEKLYENEIKAWEKEKQEFEKRQEEYNNKVENSKAEYEKSKPKAIEWYSQIILEQSGYPLNFKKKIAVEYKASEKLLIVEYFLPSIEDFPKIKEIKYLKTTSEKRR